MNPLFHAANLSGSGSSSDGATLFAGGSPAGAGAEEVKPDVEAFMLIVNKHRMEQRCPEEQALWTAEADAAVIQEKRDALEKISAVEDNLAKTKKAQGTIEYDVANVLKNFPVEMFTNAVEVVDEGSAVGLTAALFWHWALSFTKNELQEAARIMNGVQDCWFACVQPSKRFRAALRTMSVIVRTNSYRKTLVVALALVLGRKRISEKANAARTDASL